MSTLAAIGLLAGGTLLLVLGAEAIVRAGSSLAHRLGLSPLLIGLTVVAIGTSTPEIVVSGNAAWSGEGAVAFGNVVGSNVLNILLVLGLIAIVFPVAVHRESIRQDIPLVVLLSLAVAAMAWSGVLGRIEGLFLLLAGLGYLAWLYHREKDQPEHVAEVPGLAEQSIAIQLAVLGGGLTALIFGGNNVLDGALRLAEAAGLSDRVIAITVVALGTSLPELAVGLAGAWRKQVDLVMGNLVGSNLLNIALVLGGAALIRPIHVPEAALLVDLPVMVGAAVLLWLMARNQKIILRWEGAVLVLGYLGYMTYLLVF
ncbi:MAG: calcium/sodium antiporter [Thermoplasmatota archaeon]